MTKIDSINECSENGANLNGVTMHVKNHKELVSIIKGVHLKLREAFHLTRDIDKVWKAHIADEELRKIYSIAMFKLATEIWETKESRISWSYNTCVDYFKNGGIERSLLRELKIQQKWSPAQTEELKLLIFLSNEKNNYKGINRKLKLLDVGSCYNPFSKFSMFSCVAIDLTPAVEDVKQCDFLSVEVSSQENSKIDGHYITTLCEESFDIVVFSLVLEYLPATNQRMEFCTKAWKLLQRNGLLIIITPDSKRLQHNVAMMKSWKKALEKIGFIRIKYDKLTHLHCMAFRKLYKSLCNENPNEDVSDLLYIPQDFKQYSATIQSLERTEYENYILHQQFSELPN